MESEIITRPTGEPLPNKQYKCKHCDCSFEAHTSLGGHVRKFHPGNSKIYEARKAKLKYGTFDRAMHSFAKAINLALQEETLDPITYRTFKWARGRVI